MEKKLPFIERCIAAISPKMAFQRAQFSSALDFVRERAYDAAARGNRASNWRATGASENVETMRDLKTVQARSRDLGRNNPYAAKAIQAIATNTIGKGIRPIPMGLETEKAKQLKADWDLWANSVNCDYDGQNDFYGLELLIARTVVESGSALIRRHITPGLDFPLQIQVLEPDFIDLSRNTPPGYGEANGDYTIQGVQFNKAGKRIGYWLFSSHPGDGYATQSALVPSDGILHVYYKKRPGQVHGVPFLAPSVTSLYDFHEYEDAQLIRQKIAACFAVFITDPDNAGAGLPSTATNKKKTEKVVPGMIEYLGAGKQVAFSNPPAVENYEEYSTSVLRKIAAGINVSYEVMTGDYSNVNFSSGRMGWIEFHRFIEQLQDLMLKPQMCNPIWDWFISMGVILGKAKKGTKCNWIAPRREMIDPAKEIKALSEAVRNGFESWSNVVTQFGGDPETVLQQIIKDFDNFRKNELMLVCDPEFDPTRTDPNADNGGSGGNDGGAGDTGDEQTAKQKKKALRK